MPGRFNRIELNNMYENGWQSPEVETHVTGSTSEITAQQYIKNIAYDLKIDSWRNLTIIDFGAGKGDMVQVLQKFGANAIAIEPYGQEYLHRKGITVYTSIDDVDLNLKVDGVIMSNVLEHLTEPLQYLRKIYNVLKVGGWLYIGTPNSLSLNAVLHKSNWKEAANNSHVMLYGPKSLTYALQKSEFNNLSRCRWVIKYEDSRFKQLIQQFLTILGMEGELKYIALKSK